jgi:pimeloyl-ACP methyl ester carboxylesterase
LLGTSQNWQRAAKLLGEKYRVLVVDLRNHGESPHTPTHSVAEMRDDIKIFFDQHRLQKAYLLGHSMGGVLAMEFAFRYPELLSGLIIEDVAPRAYGSDSGDILQTLASIDLTGITSRQQVDEQLAQKISSPVTRQFLLTNLVRDENHSFLWRVNLPALLSFRSEMATYAAPRQARYEGEALFIGGERSAYRIDQDRDLILRHFPNSRLPMIPNVGHWIHFEALEKFCETVESFIENGLVCFKKN